MSSASFWSPEHIPPNSAWVEHGPFAFWLIGELRPRVLVELGTHTGFSYFAFCQAVVCLRTGSLCYAVDTWKGDEHAGFYEEDVFQGVNTYNEQHFSTFSTLIRSTFDEALEYFLDGSIDLLHIDGRHYYEDVKHDFESWRPKLSDRAMVLLHDINVRERGFGVFRLWNELCQSYPHFEFCHGHGLGVIALGRALPDSVQDFLAASADAAKSVDIQHAYGRLGAAVTFQLKSQQSDNRISCLEAACTDHAEKISSLEDMLSGDAAKISALEEILSGRATKISSLEDMLSGDTAKISTLEEILSDRATKISSLEVIVADRNAKIASLERMLSERVTRVCDLGVTLSKRDDEISSLKGTLSERDNELSSLKGTLSERDNELSSLLSERETEVPSLKLALSKQVEEISALQRSSSWRVTAPIRGIKNYIWRWKRVSVSHPLRFLRERYQKRLSSRMIAESSLFDREWYLARYPDVAAAGADPIRHYLTNGAKEGRDPGPLFSTRGYLSRHPDVATAGLNPLVHFIQYGLREGRAPGLHC